MGILDHHGVQDSPERFPPAQQHIVSALSSSRTVCPLRQWVRRQQFEIIKSLGWERSPAAVGAFWHAVDDMTKAGEPLNGHQLNMLESQYTLDFDNNIKESAGKLQKDLARALGHLPIARHLDLLHMLVTGRSSDSDGQMRLELLVALANALEKAGRPADAPAAWRDAQACVRAGAHDEDLDLGRLFIDPAIQRLSAAAAPQGHG